MLKIGILGFGGIGKVHKNSYAALMEEGLPIKLMSVCDIDKNRFSDNSKINIDSKSVKQKLHVNYYTDLEQMLSTQQLDLVDICLPTYLHADAAIDMLKRGYHVVSEKPMARTSKDCKRIVEAAKTAKGKIMIGQCLRFFPQYEYLKKIIEDNIYGKVISAFFDRLSLPPKWGFENWFMDYEKSGGCLLDLHIHDIDYIRHVFGLPTHISCTASHSVSPYSSANSKLFFEDGKMVVATGDWSLSSTFGFRHEYRVNFETATVIFRDELVTVYPNNNEKQIIPLSSNGGIMEELRYFINVLENNLPHTQNTPEDAEKSVLLIESLKKSADLNGEKIKC